MFRIFDIRSNHIKNIILVITCLSISSSILYKPKMVIMLPVQCFNNPYIDKILDEIRYAESSNGKYVLNINRDKKGNEISRDEGDYQLNSKCKIIFANCYNDGKMYNPYDKEVARRIARQLLLDNYNFTGNIFSALVSYNCGIGKWIQGAPYKSYQFAERIMRRIYGQLEIKL